MVKRINGDLYSDLITSADPRAMACGGYSRLPIDRIVVHHNATTNSDVAINTWLADAPAQTSAHYQIDNKRIIGIVGEETPAWHAGNGDMNRRSIGIENVNSTGAPNWEISNETFESLAMLVADIAKRYKFPIDAKHVIPHKDVFATACPGGIDMVKLRKRANELLNGSEKKPYVEPKENQIITTTRDGQLQNNTGTGKLTPEHKANWFIVKKGTQVRFKRKVGNAYEVEYYGNTFYLHNSQFK